MCTYAAIDWISTSTAIGTCVAAIAALITAIVTRNMVNEIKKQREATYKPLLILDKAYFFVKSSKKSAIQIPIVWSESRQDSREPIGNPFSESKYDLKLYNIGVGAAKSVIIKFDYDLNYFINRISNLETKIPQEIKFEISQNENSINIRSKHLLTIQSYTIPQPTEIQQRITHILPTSIQENPYLISLPELYLELINIYMYYEIEIKKSEAIDKEFPYLSIDPVIPNLNFDLVYEDIAGTSIYQHYEIFFSVYEVLKGEYMGSFDIQMRSHK